MKIKVFLCFVFYVVCAMTANAREERAMLTDYLNQEIGIEDSFAGQSITLLRENNDYFILRTYFGSGVPVIGTIKYKVIFNSSYQIAFSEIVESTNPDLVKSNENFVLAVEEKELALYLNGLKIMLTATRNSVARTASLYGRRLAAMGADFNFLSNLHHQCAKKEEKSYLCTAKRENDGRRNTYPNPR